MSTARILAIALLAFVAALAGVAVGRLVIPQQSHTGAELHSLLHGEIDLDAGQKAKLAQIESDFAARRRTLELALRAENAKLAAAIEAEHGYGPKVSATVDASHMAMGEMQKATLEHLFAMRGILKPTQTAKFDAAVVKALTDERR